MTSLENKSLLGKKITVLLLITAGLLITGILFVVNPAVSRLTPPCLFHKITGLYCPGCGSLRAIHQTLHGNIVQAVNLNILTMLSMAPVIYILSRNAFKVLANKPYHIRTVPKALSWILAAVIICFAILRNIPREPFTILAP